MYDTLSISYKIGESVVETIDEEVDPEKEYYEYRYNTVEPAEEDSPFDMGWYEIVDGEYRLSSDAAVDIEKDYYEYSLAEVEPEDGDDPSEMGWYEVSESTVIDDFGYTVSIVPKPTLEPVELDDEEDDEEE